MGCCNGGYHEFNLDWFIQRFKEIEKEWDGTKEWLKNWVESFDISGEVKKVLQGWIDDGTFEKIINEEVLGELNNKVAQNSTAIQGLDSRVKALETRKPENMFNKRFIMIADSYGEFNLFEGFRAQLNGTIVESIWKGGAGFTKTGDVKYLNMLNTLPDHNDIDYVIVFGFYNDTFDTNNLRPAIEAFVNQAKIKYPDAQIVLVNEGWSTNPAYQGNFQYLIESINNEWIGNGVTVINTYKWLHVYSRMNSDGIHPSNAGVGSSLSAIAAKILAGGNINFSFPIQQIVPTYINGWQKYGDTSEPFQEMNDSECLLHFTADVNHFGIDAGTNIKCDGHNYVEIMELPANKGCIIGSGDMLLTIPCILGDKAGKYYQASVTLEMYNRRLRIRPYMLNTTGNDYATITLNSIQFTPCTIRSNINHI